ncbi:MAG: DUF2703 domain-containing protein [Thermoplasmata archaeon]
MTERYCGDGESELPIDFFYVDLSECGRCQSSDGALDEALRELRERIHQNGISTISIKKTKITSDRQAKRYGVKRSPTLRIDGRDIEEIVNEEYEVKDSYCPSCEDVTGPDCDDVTGGGNDCRVFEYEGKSYETIPKEMIKEALMKTVGIEESSSSCCGPDESTSSCCEPDETCC